MYSGGWRHTEQHFGLKLNCHKKQGLFANARPPLLEPPTSEINVEPQHLEIVADAFLSQICPCELHCDETKNNDLDD
jgi:hypothetical protein